ncbi:MAG TPA: prepilin-type N-terminal cleavage/methylation domain-containing protein [Acidimicrobiales bacterium]|nr:prepilin-type N-terminal cleavage/methylation domain-containing protein [Acidimicrobiales bacterium]
MQEAIKKLQERRRDGEEGFTLIELMVVVLIIAILLAIAIPTFLGARTRAQDRAAQSNVRNGLTAEKTYFTDNQVYTPNATAVADLQAIEPSLQYAVGTAPADDKVYVDVTSGVLTLGTKSKSGTCYYLQDNPSGTTGTTFAKGACTGTGLTFSATGWK